MATTNKNAKSKIVTLAKDWMSIVGILLLLIVFSILSFVKFGAQYFLTWSNIKNKVISWQ